MKRSTLSLLVTAAILVLGGVALWFLVIAPRLHLPAPGTPGGPTGPTGSTTSTGPGAEAEGPRDSALNLYLTAQAKLPDGALRAELTLVKATLEGTDGRKVTFFDGIQRVTLQPDVVEKTLSERIPAGTWNRLRLTFSPAAELAYANGDIKAALLGRKEAVFAFDSEVATSRSLALFAIMPMDQETTSADKAIIANVSASPQTSETFIFGGFLLDPRGRGDLYMQKSPTLVSVIKEDLGFDISVAMKGSAGGFEPAQDRPAPQAPGER